MGPGTSGKGASSSSDGANWSQFDLACYPFLPGVQEWLKAQGLTLELLARDPLHSGARSLGLERLETSLRGETLNLPPPTTERGSKELLISYLWSRILLAGLVGLTSKKRVRKPKPKDPIPETDGASPKGETESKDDTEDQKPKEAKLTGNARLGEMAVRYFALAEAIGMQNRLTRDLEDDPGRLVEVARSLGLSVRRAEGPMGYRRGEDGPTLHLAPSPDLDTGPEGLELNLKEAGRFPGRGMSGEESVETYQLYFGDYLAAASSMRDANWKLVNQDLQKGWVTLGQRRLLRLIREMVRERLEHNLPSIEDPELMTELEPSLKRLGRILAARQARAASEGIGKLSLTKAPPCIQSLLAQTSGGVNVPHLGRFTLTAFLHAVGMDEKQILALHATAPDFSADIAQYQIEHILGRISPTEYDTPACDNLKTNGLCIDPDGLCERIKHPLGYYRVMSEDEKPPGVRIDRILLATLLDGRPQVAAMRSLFGSNKESFVKLLLQAPAREPPGATLREAMDAPGQPFRFKVRVVTFRGAWRKENQPLTGQEESLTFGIAKLADGTGEMRSVAIMDWQVGRTLATMAGKRGTLELIGQVVSLRLDEGRREWRLHCSGMDKKGSSKGTGAGTG